MDKKWRHVSSPAHPAWDLLKEQGEQDPKRPLSLVGTVLGPKSRRRQGVALGFLDNGLELWTLT